VTILNLTDRINMGNASEIEAAARQAYDQGTRNLLIDMTRAPSITSAGLRSLLVIYRLLEGSVYKEPASSGAGSAQSPSRSQHVKLLNPSAEVRRTLQIAGFDRYFESHVDLEKALASF
jgi:anti-anti-sigma regulatory factor